MLPNMGKRLRNKGRANFPATISKRSVYIGYRVDNHYRDFKVYNYYSIRFTLARL